MLTSANLGRAVVRKACTPYIRCTWTTANAKGSCSIFKQSYLLPSGEMQLRHRAGIVCEANDENHAEARSPSPSQEYGTVANPHAWPSLENIGVLVAKGINRRAPEWWLHTYPDDTTQDNTDRPETWSAYEKLDGTNVGMVASTGALLGRRYCIPDTDKTYQGVSLQTLRGHWSDVKEVERVLLDILSPSARVGAQVVVYGELHINNIFDYSTRAEPLQIGEWYVFGAAVILPEESIKDAKDQLLTEGLAAGPGAGRVVIGLNHAFADLIMKASNGRLRLPPAFCEPCSSVYEIVSKVQPMLLGAAAEQTEGVVLVGTKGMRSVIAKWKTGRTDDSLSADRLDEVLASEDATNGIFDPQTIQLMRALSDVANLNRAIPRHIAKDRARNKAKGSASQDSDPRFTAAFNSALTKIDSLMVWYERGEVSKAIETIIAEVQADLAPDGMDEEGMKKLEGQVKAAVGKSLATAKKLASKSKKSQ